MLVSNLVGKRKTPAHFQYDKIDSLKLRAWIRGQVIYLVLMSKIRPLLARLNQMLDGRLDAPSCHADFKWGQSDLNACFVSLILPPILPKIL